MNRPLRLSLVAALSIAASWAHAGTASGVATGTIIVSGDGYNYSLNTSALFQIDRTNGNVNFVPNSGFDGIGNWTAADNTVEGLKFYNPSTKAWEQPATVAKWHSWLLSDGISRGSATSPEGTVWASVVTFYGTGNIDPFMSYGFGIKNNTSSTQTYTYVQGETLVPPVSGAYNIYADIGGSLTNANTDTSTGATIGLPGSANRIQNVWLGNGTSATVDAGVGVGGAFTHNGSTATAPGNPPTQTYDPPNAPRVATALGSGSYDYWEIRTEFTLTAKDSAAFTGFAEISPIPEPETYALFAAGLLAVVVMLRRRSQD